MFLNYIIYTNVTCKFKMNLVSLLRNYITNIYICMIGSKIEFILKTVIINIVIILDYIYLRHIDISG